MSCALNDSPIHSGDINSLSREMPGQAIMEMGWESWDDKVGRRVLLLSSLSVVFHNKRNAATPTLRNTRFYDLYCRFKCSRGLSIQSLYLLIMVYVFLWPYGLVLRLGFCCAPVLHCDTDVQWHHRSHSQ